MGKLNEALAEYDIVRQLEPDFVDARWCSSAAVREANRDLPGAEADYRGAIALDPTNLTARRRLLRVLLLADKADEAEKEARRAARDLAQRPRRASSSAFCSCGPVARTRRSWSSRPLRRRRTGSRSIGILGGCTGI